MLFFLNIVKACRTPLFVSSPGPLVSNWRLIISWILFCWCRYDESEKSYKKFLELKPGHLTAEKELSQLHQAQSALDTALTLLDSGDYAKSLEYVDKVVLVFSPACSEVTPVPFLFYFEALFIIFLIWIVCYINTVLTGSWEYGFDMCSTLAVQWLHVHYLLQAKLLRVKLLLAVKDYSAVISETGYILKQDENNLEALLLRGRAYYYLADHDVATKLVSQQF